MGTEQPMHIAGDLFQAAQKELTEVQQQLSNAEDELKQQRSLTAQGGKLDSPTASTAGRSCYCMELVGQQPVVHGIQGFLLLVITAFVVTQHAAVSHRASSRGYTYVMSCDHLSDHSKFVTAATQATTARRPLSHCRVAM